MKIDVITAFEEMIDQTLSHSIVGRARKAGIIKLGTLARGNLPRISTKPLTTAPTAAARAC